MPQCGLAPAPLQSLQGLALRQSGRSVEMRVALYRLSASNPGGIVYELEPAGLINEYCHCGEALLPGGGACQLDPGRRGISDTDGVDNEAFNYLRRR